MDPNQTSKTQTPVKKPSIPIPTSKLPSGIPSGIPQPGSTSGIPTGIRKPTPINSEVKPPGTPGSTEIKPRLSQIQPPQSITTKLGATAASTNDPVIKEPIKPSTSIPTSIAATAERRTSSSSNDLTKLNNIPSSGLKAPTPVPINGNGTALVSQSVNNVSIGNGNGNSVDNEALVKENSTLKTQVKDLEEKLETLKVKRAEDRDKLKEYEKSKMTIQQLQEFKSKAQKEMSDLNRQLVQTQQEYNSVKEEYKQYKEGMDGYESRMEELTVDKELAEARVEEQQEEINQLNETVKELECEIEILKEEMEQKGINPELYQNKQSEKEIERLKTALLKLRDLSIQDKSELNNLRKQNEEQLGKINKLNKEAEALKNENSSFMNQIIDLKDQVSATLGSVDMIEQLTEQNLNLEAKVEELETQIADLESINEVDNQLIESAKEEEKELRESIDVAESKIRDFERQIESLKYSIADHEKTILKFREVVKQLQNENDKLNRQYQAKLDENKAINVSSQQTLNYDFKTKFIETKNYAKIIENESNKIEISSLRRQVNYLQSFMNENFMKRGGDNECIMTLLLFKRFISKSEFIIKEVKEKFPTIERITKEDVFKTAKADQTLFIHEIIMYLSYIQLFASRFDCALNTCSLNKYNNIGSMYFDMNIQEKSLDNLIDLLQKDQLDETINLDMVEKCCLYLNTIFKNHLIEEKFDSCQLVNDLVKYSNYTCDFISFEIQRLQALTQLRDNDLSEILLLFKEINNFNEDIKVSIKKLNRFIPKEEKKHLIFNQEILNKIDNLIKNQFKLAKYLHLMSNEAITTIPLFASDTSKDEGLPPKKLEDIAYQICDKVYLNDDSGPYENIRNTNNFSLISELFRNSLQESNDILNQIANSLENCEFERVLNAEELQISKYSANAPVLLASEIFKNTLVEAETIKYKLEAKEEEIKELKKHLKFKNDELSENKVRLSILEKKYETTQKDGEEKSNKLQQTIDELKTSIMKNEKEHGETLEALQQEIDALQNERRDLKEKIRQFTKKNIIEGIITRQSSDLRSPTTDPLNKSMNLNISDSPALIEEIKILKNTIKLLEDRNAELRVENAKVLLNNLPNFDKSKKSFNSINQNSNNEITNVCQESNKLLKELYSSLANIKIPEIKESNNKNKLLLDLQTNVQMNCLSKKCNELGKKLTQLQSDLIPGSCVKTPLNLFQTSDAKNTNTNSPVLIAEIAIPCVKGNEKKIDLFLNNNDIKDIFKTVSIA